MKKQYLALLISFSLTVGLILVIWVATLGYERYRISIFQQPVEDFPLAVKWQVSLDGSGYGSPTYENGYVFFAVDETLFASLWYGIDARTGNINWSHRVKGWNSSLDCLNSNLLIISEFRGLLALDTKTGTSAWQRQNNRWDTTCSDDEIITLVPRGVIEAYDISTGTLLWRDTKPSNRDFQSNLIYYKTAHEVLGVSNDTLNSINPKTGEIVFTFDTLKMRE